MHTIRTLALATLAALAFGGAAQADQILGQSRINSAQQVLMPGGPTLGLWQNKVFTATPNALAVSGTQPNIDSFNSSGVANQRFYRQFTGGDGNFYIVGADDNRGNGKNLAVLNYASGTFNPAKMGLYGSSGALLLQPGPTTDGGNGSLRQDWRLDDGVHPISEVGGYWPTGKTYAGLGVSKSFNLGANPGGAPNSAFWVRSVHTGTSEHVVGAMLLGESFSNDAASQVYGANILALSNPGNPTKLVGAEIDVQPAIGASPGPGSAGLYINAFTTLIPGAALQIGGVDDGLGHVGKWANGIIIKGVDTNGAGLSGASDANMGSLINTGTATYKNNNPIILSQNQFIQLGGASTMRIGLDSSSNVKIPVSNSLVFRNETDTANLVEVSYTGDLKINKMTGSGNAFACVNWNGQLFRSATACN